MAHCFLEYLPPELAGAFAAALRQTPQPVELRIRRGKPVVLVFAAQTAFLKADGERTNAAHEALCIADSQFETVFSKLCHYSVYSFKENLNACFLTLPDGSRVGVASSAVVKNGEVSAVKDISSLNVRLAADVKTAAPEVLECMYREGMPSTIIVGAPCSGKTTLLREMARILSTSFHGECRKCTVIDERGEIAAMHGGKPFFDIGINCDVLSFFPKHIGILNAVRTLSPEWIIADEIGTVGEAQSVLTGLGSGVKFLLGLHADNLEKAFLKPQFKALAKSGSMEAAVLLGEGKQLGQVMEFRRL